MSPLSQEEMIKNLIVQLCTEIASCPDHDRPNLMKICADIAREYPELRVRMDMINALSSLAVLEDR